MAFYELLKTLPALVNVLHVIFLLIKNKTPPWQKPDYIHYDDMFVWFDKVVYYRVSGLVCRCGGDGETFIAYPDDDHPITHPRESELNRLYKEHYKKNVDKRFEEIVLFNK